MVDLNMHLNIPYHCRLSENKGVGMEINRTTRKQLYICINQFTNDPQITKFK